MSVTIYWGFDPSVPITSFTLTKSVDKGVTFSALATVTFNVGGSNYNRARKQFFYTDSGGASGHVYAITATGTNGTSEKTYLIAPAEPPSKCTIVGYLLDSFGNVDMSTPVHVLAAGKRGEGWVRSPAGLVAQHGEALGLVNGQATVFPDANGMWSINLVYGCIARIHIPALEFEWVFIVPSETGPKNIRDIPQLRTTDWHTLWPEMLGSRTTIINS